MRILEWRFLEFLLAAFFVVAGQGAAVAAEDDDGDDSPVVSLPAFNVTAERLEEFGIQVSRGRPDPERSSLFWPVRTPVITAVYPNTAAARAGLRPGDRILRADGKSAASTFFSRNRWRKLETRKSEEIAASTKEVVWTLEVQAHDADKPRLAKLSVPTPAPRWGAPVWSPPEGRAASTVREDGPLADRARVILDNGIAALLSASPAGAGVQLGLVPTGKLVSGYHWVLIDAGNSRHRMFVTQQRGHTDIVLEVFEPGRGRMQFLTSPAGALERAIGQRGALPMEEARTEFEQEIAFWINGVGRVSARWPLDLAQGSGVVANFGPRPAGPGGQAPGPDAGARAPEFLALPAATAFQRPIFEEAMAKLGADEENWAYTETSRGLEDNRVTVVRYDPSRPDGERSTLLKIDGRNPTAAQVATWRSQARDTPATLGELPPLNSVIDTSDVRVFSDDFTTIVFELPLRAGNSEFPADRFQAHFRVNKARRALEDITVKMRESIRVAGVVRITDAGLQARFQTLDPAHPPQPVWLKAGGSARVLLVKVSRSFETTRTDFVRVKAAGQP